MPEIHSRRRTLFDSPSATDEWTYKFHHEYFTVNIRYDITTFLLVFEKRTAELRSIIFMYMSVRTDVTRDVSFFFSETLRRQTAPRTLTVASKSFAYCLNFLYLHVVRFIQGTSLLDRLYR